MVKRLVWAYSEGDVVEWFEKYHKELGFERILKRQHNKTPDYICLRNGVKVKVEAEYLASNFIKHKHSLKDVDVVVCVYKDVEIPGLEIISLDKIFKPFWLYYKPPWEKPVKISSEEVEEIFGKW